MDTKQEMSFKEWLARTVCATLAFCVAILALVAFVYLGMTAVVPEVENLNPVIGTCAALAVLASSFGVSSMAQWLNRGMLHSLTGLEPLPPKK
ncbi:hypothetical protein [Paraburkholderia youngii]|uniref:hypothetical protein n=1 Tax=Paraburkholderia youngii TaxID=2782701 RepID=UPI00159202AA|nr:hypothetical protein [Paraburkholderia youngii]NUX59338.1 hypothetical protein [Paraburkholderia youngii]